MAAYKDSFRFRMVIEPAAILEESFVLNRALIQDCRDKQMTLINGEIWSISSRELFNINSAFHEAVIECSRNSFFIDSLRRINRFRRLIEYRRAVDRNRALELCREHVQLADLLLAGDREAASFYMSRHLSDIRQAKTDDASLRKSTLPTAFDFDLVQNDT
jgi:DNA-binding GntR family transcriptional regulator